MEINFICPVCKGVNNIKIPEMEIVYTDDDDYNEIETKFYCQDCEKEYRIFG